MDLLDATVREAIALEKKLTSANNGLPSVVTVSAQPLLNPFSHSRGGAYPHPPSRQVTQMEVAVIYMINTNSTNGSVSTAQKHSGS